MSNFLGCFFGSFLGFIGSVFVYDFISAKKAEKDFKDRWLE